MLLAREWPGGCQARCVWGQATLPSAQWDGAKSRDVGKRHVDEHFICGMSPRIELLVCSS